MSMVKKLKSAFTIGFELEGVLDQGVSGTQDLFKKLNNELGATGNMHWDGSIRYNRRNNETAFEYSSPIIKYTPSNIDRVIKCLDKLPTMGVTTNRTCGFHTHIACNGITKEDTIWFIFWLCATDNFEKFRKLGRTNLYGSRYAKFSFLEDIAHALRHSDASILPAVVRTICTNEKYRAIRIHPQGTIEWRGPRTFLNTPTHKKTLSFFKKLDEFISCFIESMNINTVMVNNNVYTKEQVLECCGYHLTHLTFKTMDKVSFMAKLLGSPQILDKMRKRDLDKSKNDVITTLQNISPSVKFTSKVLLKWLKENELDKYIINHFGLDVLLDDAESIYSQGRLYETLKNIDNSFESSEKVFKAIVEWYNKGLYSNTIGLYLNYVLNKDVCRTFLMEVVETGMFKLISEENQKKIVHKYIEDFNYYSNSYSFNYFKLGREHTLLMATLKKHNLA
jgi:hypothetical protein